MKKIRCALLSVWHKADLVPFAARLRQYDVALLATGGTAALLQEHGLPVTPVDALTGMPALLGGRVKSLHPLLYGGILARRSEAAHLEEAARHGFPLIDLVVVDLYPFAEAAARGDLPLEALLEHIDIGGPALLRAAAKNFPDVAVLCSPQQYGALLAELEAHGGATRYAFRRQLAREAFRCTALYDALIGHVLAENGEAPLPPQEVLPLLAGRPLRYGENPHQRAILYQTLEAGPSLLRARQLHGKALSFNNLADADAALAAVCEFAEPAVVIVKHQTPCGVALGTTPAEAYERAYATDPDAASGGVICTNRPVDLALAEAIGSRFFDLLLAPDFAPAALEVLKQRKNRILLALDGPWHPLPRRQLRSIAGGVLVQETDTVALTAADLRVVTKRQPSDAEVAALLFAWKVVKHVKSNAIVLARQGQTVGIGAGQMSRVDASRLAVRKARQPLAGCVAASDAFFPFRDGLDELARAGVRAVIQPGGSVRDAEVIAAADEQEVAMVFTGRRAFRH